MSIKKTRFAVPVLLAALLMATTPRLLRADQDVCLKTKESALQMIDAAFGSKKDMLLKISKAAQDKGVDPHRYPVVMPGGSVEKLDLIETLSRLAAEDADAVSQIEQATRDCENNVSGAEKITTLAQFLSGEGLSSKLPSQLAHIDANQTLSGHPLGGWNSLTPKKRDDILLGLNIGGEVANIIRDPTKCITGFVKCSGGTKYSALDQALNKLVAGNVAFNNPQQMTVGRPKIVEVKLSTTLSPSELKAKLTEAGSQEAAGLSVGDRMSATLNGGVAFDISPAGPQVQWISQTQVTTWTWNVTPKVSGIQYLILSFDAVISLEGKEATRNVQTLTHEIKVDVGWPATPAEWFDWSKKWFEDISWLWITVLVPVGLFLVGWWRRWARP